MDGGFQIGNVSETGVQYFVNAIFQIRKGPQATVDEIMYGGSQSLMKPETVVQKILNANFQKAVKSETSVHMITRLRFPSNRIENRRSHDNAMPIYTSINNWWPASDFNENAGFQMNPDKGTGVQIKMEAGPNAL